MRTGIFEDEEGADETAGSKVAEEDSGSNLTMIAVVGLTATAVVGLATYMILKAKQHWTCAFSDAW